MFMEGQISLVVSWEPGQVGGDGDHRECFPLDFFFWILSKGIAPFKKQYNYNL